MTSVLLVVAKSNRVLLHTIQEALFRVNLFVLPPMLPVVWMAKPPISSILPATLP